MNYHTAALICLILTGSSYLHAERLKPNSMHGTHQKRFTRNQVKSLVLPVEIEIPPSHTQEKQEQQSSEFKKVSMPLAQAAKKKKRHTVTQSQPITLNIKGVTQKQARKNRS